MALVCDYCGDVTESTNRVSVAFGHNQEIALKGATAKDWFYYCDDECAEAVSSMLTNLRLFAMHGEGSGLVWALTEQKVAPVGAVDPKPAGATPPEAAAKPEGFDWDSATPFEERQQQRREIEQREESDDEKERKGELPLTWWLHRETKIPISELKARQAAGVPVTAVSHQGSVGNLHKAGVATLEDAAAMTEVEFAGLPGIGAKIVEHISRAMTKNGLEFKPGPELTDLGRVLRDYRNDAGVGVEDLAVAAAAVIGAPEMKGDGSFRSTAVRGVDQMIRDAERGAKAAAPQILDALGEALGFTRPGVLAQAMEVGNE